MALHCFAYLGSATSLFNDDGLESLIATSRRNNAAMSVTGMLCYFDKSFLQIIEGEQSAVEDAVSRIRADARHTGLIEVYNRAVEQRTFSDWSMALMNYGHLPQDLQETCRNLRSTLLPVSPDRAQNSDLEGVFQAFRMWLR